MNGVRKWRFGRLLPAFAAGLAIAGAGCDAAKEQLGLSKRAPDEFTVVTKAPLVIPPDFTLRPPQPGARRPQEPEPSSKAREAIVDAAGGARTSQDRAASSARNALAAAGSAPGNAAADGRAITTAPVGESEVALLRLAGAQNAESSIRELVNRETSQLAGKDSSFADRLIFWQTKQPYGSTLDARKEAQRLREAAATGASANEGETPVIRQRKRGWFEGIF
jgi:hypothetical protein